MQTSVPELTDISQGAGRRSTSCTAPSRASASFANNCLLARRLVERGVRFVQLYHRGWDHHGTEQRRRHRQPPARALPRDRPGGGRAGHRPEAARAARRDAGRLGRRVRPHADERRRATARSSWAATTTRAPSPIWMAGGGIKPGVTVGATDELGYNVGRGPGPRPRPARDDPAPAGPRPHEADLPLPGPRLPPDRRRGERDREAAGLSRPRRGRSPRPSHPIRPKRARHGSFGSVEMGRLHHIPQPAAE